MALDRDFNMPAMQLLNKPHYHGVFLLLALFLASYFEIIAWVIKGWFRLDNAYSLLIFLLFLYMLWNTKKVLLHLPAKPNLPIGILILLLGCVTLIAGKLSGTLLLQGISFVLSLLGLVWLILGNDFARTLWVPITYLIFMFYLFEELLSNLSAYFQHATAWIAARLLDLGGMPVMLDGYVIQLPHISLEVAKVCNGINHLLAIVAIAIPFTFLSSFTRYFKAIVILTAVMIGIVANGLRVTMIAIWSKYNPGGPLHGPFDIFYVSFILILGLIFISLVLTIDKFLGQNRPKPIPTSVSSLTESRSISTRKVFRATCIGIFFFAVSIFYLAWHHPKQILLEYPLQSIPRKIGLWKGRDVVEPNWPVKNLSADVEMKRIYLNASTGAELGLYIGYYRSQHQNKELINDQLAWLHLREKQIRIPLQTENLTILRGKARGIDSQTYTGDKRHFYFWYRIDGESFTDRYAVKLKLLSDNFIKNRSNGALILLSIDHTVLPSINPDATAVGFIEQVYPYLQEVLPP
jgi:EpsI family protein